MSFCKVVTLSSLVTLSLLPCVMVATFAQSSSSRVKPPAPIIVGDFEKGSLKSPIGFGWALSTDSINGGKSTANYKFKKDGPVGAAKALEITGLVSKGAPYPWSGIMYFPGQWPMKPANISAYSQVSFWAKGDGKNYSILLFDQKHSDMPAQQSFVAGKDWKEYTFKFQDFDRIDGSTVTGIAMVSTIPGNYQFDMDKVELK